VTLAHLARRARPALANAPVPEVRQGGPVLGLRYEHLRMNGWKPCKTFTMVNWCGHGQEYQPWLQPDGWWLLIPTWE